jgi:hypothetical protein
LFFPSFPYGTLSLEAHTLPHEGVRRKSTFTPKLAAAVKHEWFLPSLFLNIFVFVPFCDLQVGVKNKKAGRYPLSLCILFPRSPLVYPFSRVKARSFDILAQQKRK